MWSYYTTLLYYISEPNIVLSFPLHLAVSYFSDYRLFGIKVQLNLRVTDADKKVSQWILITILLEFIYTILIQMFQFYFIKKFSKPQEYTLQKFSFALLWRWGTLCPVCGSSSKITDLKPDDIFIVSSPTFKSRNGFYITVFIGWVKLCNNGGVPL